MYRNIHTSIWTDPKVRELQPTAKLFFVYLITCPHAHLSGIFYLPDILIAHETGLKGLASLWDTLSIGYLVHRDRVSEIVWVTNMLRYQSSGEKSYISALIQLKNLHQSPLIDEYLYYYKDLLEPVMEKFKQHRIPYRYPIDTLSPRARVTQEQEQEQEQNIIKPPQATKQKKKPVISEDAVLVLNKLNETTGKKFTDALYIQARLSNGVTVNECMSVIAWWDQVWCADHPSNRDFFDNQTPFRPTKFDTYRAKAESWEHSGRKRWKGLKPSEMVAQYEREQKEKRESSGSK